jgi:hypothetical protein
MKGICLASVLLVLIAPACDATSPGARTNCAQGGELTDCPDTGHTAADVCWRLVDCGAIALNGEEDYSFDWGRCMEFVEGMPDDQMRLVSECVAASTCDQLRVNGSPTNPDTDQMYCVALGRDF